MLAARGSLHARGPRTAALLVAAWLAAGCGDPSGEPARVRHVVAADGRAPAYGEAPMPSDALRGADGRFERFSGLEAIAPGQSELLSQHLAALDGFGVRPTVEFHVDGAIDPSSLPAASGGPGEPVFVVELDEAGAVVRAIPYAWRWDAARRVVVGTPSPGMVLRAGAPHAAVITSEVRSSGGHPLEPAPPLAGWRADPEQAPPRWSQTASALSGLEAAHGGAAIAGIAAFTTQRATETLMKVRKQIDELPPPALSFDDPALVFDEPPELDALLGVAERDAEGRERWGWTNPTGIAHEHVAVVATGTMTLPRFRRPDTGTDDPADETFELDSQGGAVLVDGATPVPITFVLPAGPPPPQGFPVALFGHGLGASRHAVLTFAEPLARAGFAVVAIDMDGHGSRLEPEDEKNNLAEVLTSFGGDAGLRDGFGDHTGLGTTLDLVEGFVNLAALRDSVRQSVLDLGGVVRLLKDEALDLSALSAPYGGTAPRLDARRVAYLGESYGAVVGSVFAAVEPEVDLFVLDVGGGGILDLALCEAPGLRELVIPFVRSVYGVEGELDRFHPLVGMAQSILDGADPLAYAPHVLDQRLDAALGPRHVVLLEVVGDEVIPNIATEALARAMGLELLAPRLHQVSDVSEVASPASANVAGQTAVIVHYAPAVHGSNWTSERGTLHYYPGEHGAGDDRFLELPAPIEIDNPLYETLEQVVEILRTHQDSGIPSVRSTKAPVADFDGDGVSDDDEIAAGTDPHHPG